jgi:hypothetical protein
MHYGAGAAELPSRNRTALALIFGMHILALLAWMQQRPVRLPDTPHVVSILLRPSMPQARPEPAPPPEPGYPRPRQRKLPPAMDFFGFPSARPPASAPSTPAQPEPAVTPAAPAAAASPPASSLLDDARAPLSVQDAIREQKEAEGGFGLSLAKRQAGRIDRELRKGKSGVPDEPDTPMGRFRRGLEQAHVDRSWSVREDSYTSPDGTIIYRKRIGKGSICRRGGSVSPLGMNSMAMGGEAKNDIPCPKGVDWKTD